jgi:WD40 repeat protein
MGHRRGESPGCEGCLVRLPAKVPVPRLKTVVAGLLLVVLVAASVGVWRLLPPRPRAAWPGCFGAAFTPDGRTLVTYDRNRRVVRLIDVASGAERAALPVVDPDTRAESVNLAFQMFALSPDGGYLAVPAEDEGVRVWRLETLKEKGTVRSDDGECGLAVAGGYELSPGGRFLVAGWGAWDVTTGRRLDARLADQPVFSSDGRWMAYTIDREPTPQTRIRDLETAAERAVPEGTSLLTPAFSADNKLLVVWDYQSVTVLDVGTGQKRFSLSVPPPGIVGAVAFTPDSRRLAVATAETGHGDFVKNGTVTLYELASQRAAGAVTTVRLPDRLSFDRSGRLLITEDRWSRLAEHTRSKEVWDLSVTPARSLWSPPDPKPPPDATDADQDPAEKIFEGRASGLEDVVSPDGRVLALCRENERKLGPLLDAIEEKTGVTFTNLRVGYDVTLVELATGKPLASLPGSGRPVFSPDETLLATDNPLGHVRLWDVPPPKSHPWLAGLPAVAALFVLLLYRRFRFRRTRSVAVLP